MPRRRKAPASPEASPPTPEEGFARIRARRHSLAGEWAAVHRARRAAQKDEQGAVNAGAPMADRRDLSEKAAALAAEELALEDRFFDEERRLMTLFRRDLDPDEGAAAALALMEFHLWRRGLAPPRRNELAAGVDASKFYLARLARERTRGEGKTLGELKREDAAAAGLAAEREQAFAPVVDPRRLRETVRALVDDVRRDPEPYRGRALLDALADCADLLQDAVAMALEEPPTRAHRRPS